MMTKKTMTIVSVFMVVALTAVGFAAWLITGTIDYKAEGSFVANELDDKYFKVEVAFDEHIVDIDGTDVDEARNNGKVIFGRPTDDNFPSDKAWLSYSVNDEKEKLTVIATVKFIPDGGFSRNIANQEDKDMKYYLYEEKESGSVSDPTITKQYRTIRVKIDINEFFETKTVDGVTTTEQKTMNHQWFDWAVQLGYLQYPTAHVVETNADGTATYGEDYTDFTKASADYKFGWAANETQEKGAIQELDLEGNAKANDKIRFEKGYLCLDLTYEMFDIQYANASATTATEAIAKVVINFNWGEALKVGTDYLNPYEFFELEAHKPENEINIFEILGVKQYLITTPDAEAGYNTYSLGNLTTAEADANSDEIDDRKQGASACIIRYKDLAQRVLDYIRDCIDSAHELNADGSVKTANLGLKYSFELLEGEPKPKNAN